MALREIRLLDDQFKKIKEITEINDRIKFY